MNYMTFGSGLLLTALLTLPVTAAEQSLIDHVLSRVEKGATGTIEAF